MDDLQAQMNSILANPELMDQIKSIAQNIGTESDEESPSHTKGTPETIPNIDFNMLQKLSGIAGQSNIDKNQRTLLSALAPYLSSDRLHKLEKAMRASKMAGIATTLLSNTGR